MLKNLSIKNVALIRQCNIDFDKGLNVLSGETGAGKSVVLEALNFALGQKADRSMICHGENECSVSCSFDVSSDSAVCDALNELGIEYEEDIIVKRTMNTDGRSTIRLNGEIVTAAMLRKVTSQLVDVHGQSDHYLLMNESNQLALIDSIGGREVVSLKERISAKIEEIRDADKLLSSLGGDESARARKIDYLEYAIGEIERAELSYGEEEALSERKRKLMNLEKISVAAKEAAMLISGDGGAEDLVSEAVRKLAGITQYGKEYELLSARLESLLEELADISESVDDSCNDDYDPNEIEKIERRLDVISDLKKKYGKNYDEIISSLSEFKNEFEEMADSAQKVEKLQKSRAEAVNVLDGYYDDLTSVRKKIATKLSSDLSAKLKELNMKSANFQVDFRRQDGEVLSVRGRDLVTFMFTANKGEVLKPLNKIISGGELSRLMLAVKAVTVNSANGVGTFIFDEIDVGISGAAAQVVAENFAKISVMRQIIAVSHLPQIVAMADHSYLIYKNETDDKTVTNVRQLDEVGKINEVLRLIGGTFGNNAATEHAKDMIYAAKKFKEESA